MVDVVIEAMVVGLTASIDNDENARELVAAPDMDAIFQKSHVKTEY